MSDLKMFFICDGARDWWVCHGVLSNGFYFGNHVCSHPGFARGDLNEEAMVGYYNYTNGANFRRNLE